jgi:hypothetical protein
MFARIMNHGSTSKLACGFMLAVLSAGVLSGCTDREEAAKEKIAEAGVHMASAAKAVSYADKLKSYEHAFALIEEIKKRFASTAVAKSLSEGQVVDGVNIKELANQLDVVRPRAIKEGQQQAMLLDFEQERDVVKSFFVQEGECHDEPQRVQCLGYSTQISAKVLGNGKATDAVVVDIKKSDDQATEMLFRQEFLKLYRIDVTKFDALMKSISSGLESSFVQDGIRVSGVTAQPDATQPIYRVVIRSVGAQVATEAAPKE